MCIPLRSMERTWPLGRMCAEPPPFSATCFPGGVCGPLVFAPAGPFPAGPLAFVPAGPFPAGPLAFAPAGPFPAGPPLAFAPAAGPLALDPLFGPLPAGPLAFAPLLGPLAVPAGPLAFGPPAPGVEPRWPPGAEPCCAPGAAECEGGDCLGGLACCCGAAGLGAASFEFGFCPQANIGTAITIESKIDFRRTLSLITRNLITASRQSELFFVTSPAPTLQAP